VKPWLVAFAVTQLVEVPIYRSAGASWLGAFGASCITHPVVWFVIPRFLGRHYEAQLVVSEGFAVALEAAWLASLGVKRPIEWAFAANAASFCAGLALHHFRVI
jgi:hypothetical protein